LTLCSVHL